MFIQPHCGLLARISEPAPGGSSLNIGKYTDSEDPKIDQCFSGMYYFQHSKDMACAKEE